MERQEPSSAIPVVRHLAAAALVAVLGGGFTTQAVAQEAPELEAGMRVRVSATGCPQCFVVGRLETFDAERLSLRLDGETMSFPLDSIASLAVSRGKSWVPPVVGGVGGLLIPTGVFLAIFCSDPDTSCDGENVLIVTALIGVPSAAIGTLVGLLLRDERWEPVLVDAFTAHIGPGGIGFGVSFAW